MPHQGVTADEALHMFTAGAAAALGELEPLAPGAAADFVVIDRDPVAASPDELRHVNVRETYVAGNPVAVDRTRPSWND